MRSHFPTPRNVSLTFGVSVLVSCSALALSACGGGAAPPPPPVVPAKPIAAAVAVDPPVDLSRVAEPAGLIAVGRIAKADAIVKALVSWTRFPVPSATDLVRSMADDSVADAVDVSQPIDAAVALGGSKRDPKPLIAISVPVRSFEDAKAKIGAHHKLSKGKNGQLVVEGIGRAAARKGRGLAKGEEEEEDNDTCVLAPAPSGARLVCGERDAVDALSPYLTRTVSLEKWTSDIHVDVTLAAVREPLSQVKAMLPILARQLLGGSSPALAQIVDAGVNELLEFVGDTNHLALDAQVGDAGLQMALKMDFQKSQSVLARIATSNPQKADAPPPAFWHLPMDTDMALFSKGSDPKLFDHPRELLGKALLEVTQGAAVPDAEGKTVRELVIDRMLGMLTNPLVYGHGFDAAAVDKAVAGTKQVKAKDDAGDDEAARVLGEEVFGWHLLQVSDPITKVGPLLKDWAQLWNRPAFVKWAKGQASSAMLAQFRIAPTPAGVTLPKDTVHLEIVQPRRALTFVKPNRTVQVKPHVLHFLAVPDQGGTWLGLGLDGKLLAQKAAAALSSAPEAATLAKAPHAQSLRGIKANGALVGSVRGFLSFAALDRGGSVDDPFTKLKSLPGKGTTPVVISFAAQPPSQTAAAGSGVTTIDIPRGAIEDIVRIGMGR